MKLLVEYQNTRENKEDIALTPYLFGVYINSHIKVYGIGLCWLNLSGYVGIGFNIPDNYKEFLDNNK